MKKKSNTSIIIILLAVVMIATGIILIVTGNNKSFWNEKKDKKTNENKNDEEKIPPKGLVPNNVTEEEIAQLLIETKEAEFPNETWTVDYVKIVGHDEENERLLVSYCEVHEDFSMTVKQTIVSILNGDKRAELPGWLEGERDLTVYNFIVDYEILPNESSVGFNDFEDYEYSESSLDE